MARKFVSKRKATEVVTDLIEKAFDRGYRKAEKECAAADQSDYVDWLEGLIDDATEALESGDSVEALRLLRLMGKPAKTVWVAPEELKTFWVKTIQ